MDEKELLEQEFIRRQAQLDQAWSALEPGLISIKQIQGCMDQTGVIAGYIAIMISQIEQNKLKRALEAM